jgi:superfamily I DNA and/or RNA helicase/very-short-patch-repair endonuclease
MKTEKIFERYKNRLINISGRNRTLFLNKLYKKRSFDLYALEKFKKDISKEIIEYLIDRNNKKLFLLIDDPYNWRKEKEKELNIKNLKELTLEEQQKLNEIEKIFNEMISSSKSLKTLKREIDAIEKETGRYELYVGYPFVEGKFKDGSYVKSPLFLFPVTLIRNGDKCYLNNLKEDVLVNKVFLIAYSNYNEVKVNVEIDYVNPTLVKNSESIVRFFKEKGVDIEYDDSSGNKLIEKFIEGKDSIKYNQNGYIRLRNYAILGVFHLASSIYNDYEKLGNNGILNHKLLNLLLLGNNEKEENINNEEKECNEKIEDKNFYYISQLDFTQEKAIKKVDSGEAIVIYGPPGTGKSQTIANLIVNSLSKGKKVLMVSEKRTALDVIYNRLSKLQSKIMLIHDAQKNKKGFYTKTKEILESINFGASLFSHNANKNSEKMIEFDITQFSQKIDKNIEILEKLGEALYKIRDFGLSLQQMYAMTTKNILTEERDLFKRFKKHFEEVDRITYKEISMVMEKVNNENVILKYERYKNIQKKYSNIISQIKKELDKFEIVEYMANIEDLLEKFGGILKVQLTSNYKEKIQQLFLEGKFEENNLKDLSKRINREENFEKFSELEKLKKINWWNPLHLLLKKRRIEKANNIEKELFEKEERIYKNMVGDYELLKKLYINTKFIDDIVLNYKELFKKIILEEDQTMFIKNLRDFLNVYEEYYSLKFYFKDFSKLEIEFLEFAYKNSNSDIEKAKNIVEKIPSFFILNNIIEIEKKESDVLSYYKEYNNLVKSTREYMERKKRFVPEYIVYKWNKIFNEKTLENPKLLKEFQRQVNKKRNLFSLRKFIEDFRELVFDFYPCWLLTPETVSEILPLDEGLFDLIIFDEASQIFVEKAIPSIYRSKKIAIAGDDKQLRPNSLFISRWNLGEDEEIEDLEIAAAVEEESLLDLAKVNFDSTHLLFHYRSLYEELINFSNYAFYEGKLYIAPNVNKNEFYKPIERIKVKGIWKNRQNLTEAKEVVNLVKRILKERKENETIGIITFNVNQKDLIEDLLDEEARNDPNFEQLYTNELNRKENEEDKSIFVKNIENVQGDERDIIIFSTGYAPDDTGRLRFNFGDLSNEYGENKLNVAISRAKKKIYMITSIEPEDLKVEESKNMGPKFLKEYLKYVRAVSKGYKEEAYNILYALSGVADRNKVIKFDSPFEEEVYEKLRESHVLKNYKLKLETQIKASGYRIDIGVYDPIHSKYILGIECDGFTYHSSKSARERDIHRQKFLESKGWKILRIWSKKWWENPNKEIERIENEIKTLVENDLNRIADNKVG